MPPEGYYNRKREEAYKAINMLLNADICTSIKAYETACKTGVVNEKLKVKFQKKWN